MGGAQNHKANAYRVKSFSILPQRLSTQPLYIMDGFRKLKSENTTSRSKVVVIIGCTSQTRNGRDRATVKSE